MSFRHSDEILTVWSLYIMFERKRQTQLVMMWLCPYVLDVLKCSEGAPAATLGGGSKQGQGRLSIGNAPLATTSRLPGDKHHSSTDVALTHMHKFIQGACTYISILWQSPHIYTQSACISKRNSRKKKNRARKGHFSSTPCRCVCLCVCVCTFWGWIC